MDIITHMHADMYIYIQKTFTSHGPWPRTGPRAQRGRLPGWAWAGRAWDPGPGPGSPPIEAVGPGWARAHLIER